MIKNLTKGQYLKYIMFHPIEGFEELRFNKAGSIKISIIILVVSFIASMADKQLTGFIFTSGNKQQYNVLYDLFSIFGITLIFIICNWSVCTLFDGEGRLKDILVVTAYALLPRTIFIFLNVILSHLLTRDESIFIDWLYGFGVIWSVFVLIVGLMVIHQYTFGKTILSIVATIIGMLFVLFIFILLFSLFNQLISFIQTIYKEIVFRL